MTTARNTARTAAVLKALSDLSAEAYKRAKADVAEHLDVGDRKTATLEDGTKIGTVSYSDGRKTPRVYGDTAFLDYVRQHYPGEIVQTVRPSFIKTLLESGTVTDTGELCDSTTGELIPGVEVRNGDPYISVRQDNAAVRAIAAAWQRGELPFLTDTLALPAHVGPDKPGACTCAGSIFGRFGPTAAAAAAAASSNRYVGASGATADPSCPQHGHG